MRAVMRRTRSAFTWQPCVVWFGHDWVLAFKLKQHQAYTASCSASFNAASFKAFGSLSFLNAPQKVQVPDLVDPAVDGTSLSHEETNAAPRYARNVVKMPPPVSLRLGFKARLLPQPEPASCYVQGVSLNGKRVEVHHAEPDPLGDSGYCQAGAHQL